MKIRELESLLSAKLLCGEDHLDRDVYSACCSDMMSDVLAYVKDQGVLLTGLVNPQVIRTALMMDMNCIIFVRSKSPNDEMIRLANEHGIVMMSTAMTLYTACGTLYTNGLIGTKEVSK